MSKNLIVCVHDIAKYSGKGHCGFLGDTSTLTLSKSETFKSTIQNFARLIIGALSRAVPKIKAIGCTGRHRKNTRET